MKRLLVAAGLAAGALGSSAALDAGATLIDVLLGLETAALLLVGLPLSIRGTFRLVEAVRVSTANDRLARAITGYLGLVTGAAIYLLGLTVWRFVTGHLPPDWLRPVTGGILLGVLVGPWWIERAVNRSGPTDRDRTP
jgi:hypothetical protein